MVTNKNSMTNTMMTMKTIRKYKAQTRAKAIAIAMISFLFFVLLSMQLKLMTWNVRGLMSSTMCLANLLRDTDCDFVILSEHKLPQMYSNYLDSVDNRNFLSQSVNLKSVMNCMGNLVYQL